MANIASMSAKLSLDSTDFDNGLKGAQGSADSFASKMSKVGGAMTAGITAPILGIGAAAVSMSSTFNAQMANIASLGVPIEHVNAFKTAIQDLSIETGQSTGDIADGMYQVISAFGDTKDTVKILTTNVKLAKSGLASTAEAIALTSAVTKGYNDTSAEAVLHTADLASTTVALGQTTLPELAGAIGTVTPLAGNLGIKMEDMFAVMATGSGVTGSSGQVATQFRGILQSLMAPTADMTALTKQMGYENGAAMLKAEGLQKTIEAIVGAAESTGKPLQSFIGSIEGQTLALALAGPQAETFTRNLEAMQNTAGASQAAFLAQTQGIDKIGFSMDQARQYAEVLGQKLGDALAPMLGVVLDKVQPLADYLIKLVDSFVKMDPATQNWALAGVALLAALGPLLMILPGITAAMGGLAAVIGLISWPVVLAIAAVAALGAAWATNFGGIQEKTAAAIEAMRPAFEELLKWIDLAMKGDFSGLWKEVGAALVSVQVAVANFKWADYITALTDWALYIAKVVWSDYIVKLADWAIVIGKVVWTDYITKLDWKTIGLTALDWATWIPAILWTTFISPLVWSLQIAGFLWNTFITNLTWSGFVTALKSWALFVNPLAWITFISALDWGTFVGKLGWASWIVTFAWDSFIKKVEWLSFIPRLTWPSLKAPAWGDFIPDLKWPSIPSFPGWAEILKSFGWGAPAAPTPSTQGYNTTPPAGGTSNGGLPIDVNPPMPEGTQGNAGGLGAALAGIPGAELGGLWGAGGAGGVVLNNYGPIASNIDVAALAFQVAQYLDRRRA